MVKKPNILFIFSDQHRGDTMGCVGHPAVIAPNLDKLTAEGVVFRQCSTNSPVCVPARCTMMSGQYVNQHGAWDNSAPADRHGPSHVRNIRDAGYHTALIGKTHLWEPAPRGTQRSTKDIAYQLQDWGFVDTMELVSTVYGGGLPSAWSDHLASKGLLEGYIQSIREFNRVNWGFQRKPWEDPPAPLPVEDHIDSFCGRKAVEWVNNYKENKPFYLQVLFPGPHPPFNSAPEYRARYQWEKMPIGIMEPPREPIPPYVDYVLRWSNLGDMTAEQMQKLRVNYYAKITLIDEWIGNIIKALRDRGFLDNTWIIYTSDHGENLGDHRLNQKVVFYESAIHVPFIVRPPGGIKAWQSNALTDHIDMVATMLEVAGAKPLVGCEGRSLAAQVQAGPEHKGAQKGKEAVFSEVVGHSMVKTDRWKMAVDAKTKQPVEFFDEVNDPSELRNLVNEPALEKVRQELGERYINRLLSHMDLAKFEAWEKRREGRVISGTRVERQA